MTDRLALGACASTFFRPAQVLSAVRLDGLAGVEALHLGVSPQQKAESATLALELESNGFQVLFLGDDGYPAGLLDLQRPPALVFAAGDMTLLKGPGVGMCGSRNASEAGLRAAWACGTAVAQADLVVISGNAKGVDTAAHSGALEAGGRTVLVLAEGPLRYRPRREIRSSAGERNLLVVSQFAPRATWNVGNAMTRNGVIAALGDALVVIEARDEGGTLDAGLQGLQIGRPVIALEFESSPTPAGNAILLSKGAMPVSSPRSLTSLLEELRATWAGQPQLSLPLAGER